MNIGDIAKLAGVSKATISRYFNDGYVSEAKRQAIRRVIEETGYQPSSHAQMLRTRKSRLVGVIIPKLNSQSISRMVSGINKTLMDEDYFLLLGDTENDERKELEFLDIFTQYQVDGVILIGTVLSSRHRRALLTSKVPVVLLGQQLDDVSSVCHDNYRGARAMASELALRGENVAMITVTELDVAAGADRRRGFVDALTEAGKFRPELMVEADFDLVSGRNAAESLLTQHPEIDTIFCATDNIALGALSYLSSTGVSVPGRVQVAGVGDTLVGNVLPPGLTSVHFPYEESGVAAAELMLEQLRGLSSVPKTVQVGYRLELRDSIRAS